MIYRNCASEEKKKENYVTASDSTWCIVSLDLLYTISTLVRTSVVYKRCTAYDVLFVCLANFYLITYK